MTQVYTALAVCFLLTLVIGKFLIPQLRRLKAGQEIREDGPKWHAGKAGTPAMGGIMFIVGSGVTVFVLGWQQMLAGEFVHLYVYLFALICVICFVLSGRSGLYASQIIQFSKASEMGEHLEEPAAPVP